LPRQLRTAMLGCVITLLLDVDGTLIDSFPGIRAGFIHALDAVGWEHPDDEFIARIPGPPMEETLASVGMDDPTRDRAFRAYMDFTHAGGWKNAQAFPGMRDLLKSWKEEGFQVVTATSKGEGFARAILEREGMLEFIDFLGAAQEDGPRRRKADVIAHVLDNVEVGRGLMIGDRLHDIEGAAQFGLSTAAVTWGYGTQNEWNRAWAIAHTPAELARIVTAFKEEQ